MAKTKGQVFHQLETKLANNLKRSLNDEKPQLKEVEINARSCAVLGQILSERENLLSHQEEIIAIFDEVFSDLIVSIYLAGTALDKPAQIVLRRALELGISITYLWDLPHVFWGWKMHDVDLSFSDILEHLIKPNYVTFIKSLNSKVSRQELFDEREIKRLYRVLSNTTHGKIATFESNLPERFTYSSSDWENHLDLVKKVQKNLLGLWHLRFFDSFSELYTRIPALSRIE